jgi:uncharacterized phage protein gp47/JayE
MLNEQGYHRPTYEELLAGRIQLARELFGEDIETDEKTPLGKFIRIGAYDLAKAYEDIENVYYARFPNTANGLSLDRLCVFAGITRNPATQALHSIKVYGEAGTVIGIGELVVSSGDITFYTANEYTISEDGYVTVTVECSEAGIVGNVTSITEIVNPSADIDSIEYIGLEQAGEDEENDVELRKRFSKTIEGSGGANENAIRAALLRVPFVESVGIFVNETDTEDSSNRPARSFQCYVYAPSVAEEDKDAFHQQIAEAIYDKKPVGIKTYGDIKKTVIDNGGYPHEIFFSETEVVPIKVKMSIITDTKFEEDGIKQIKNTIVSYIDGLGGGTDVILTTLYGYIYKIPGVVEVTSLQLAKGDGAFTNGNIIIGEWQAADANAEYIEVN